MGEASHPGPTRISDEDEVLDNLEVALTMIDSDDEPVSRLAHSRTDGRVREAFRGHHQAPQSTVDDSDATVGHGAQIRTQNSGLLDAFVGTPSLLVSCQEPDVGFAAPRKKLRIRRGRESQASTVVAVQSSEPSSAVPRTPNVVDNVSPQVQVEPAGSQVAGLAVGRFAALAAGVEDDGVRAQFSSGCRPFECFSRSQVEPNREHLERSRMEGSSRPFQAIDVPKSVCDALEFDVTHADSDDPVRIQNRFGIASEDSDEESAGVVGDEQVGERESVPSIRDEGSEVSVDEEREPPTAPDPEVISTRGLSPAIRAAFAELDGIDLAMEFSRRAVLMKSVPHFLKGPYRSAMKLAMEKATQFNLIRQERGWRLFLLLPRLLLYRPPRGGNIHKSKLAERFQAFAEGQWSSLLRQSRQYAEEASAAQHRKRRRQNPQHDMDRRAARAESLVQLGELSAGRQALEGASVAPGTRRTLDALRDPGRRPPKARDLIPGAILNLEPEVPFQLDEFKLASNVQSARRGAAPGPSGMSAEHLRLVLDNVRDTNLLYLMAEQLARGRVSPSIADALRLGRMNALQKPNGGVRGIVAGDVLRRLVGRTVAQQVSEVVEAATRPHQYAMSTRAGTGRIAHIIQVLTESNPRSTVLSIDGVGAYDSISRKAMLEALVRMPGGSQILPFVRLFYGRPSQYLWEDNEEVVHRIAQGEGGEQGDALMPLLFSLGQHAALEAVKARMLDGEVLLAFLDDVYVITTPERVGDVYVALQEELYRHARIRIHVGKTQVWNAAAERPDACEVLERVAQVEDPSARVWKGSDIPTAEQEVIVLGTPLRHVDFVEAQLTPQLVQHSVFFPCIPLVAQRAISVVTPAALCWRPCQLSSQSCQTRIRRDIRIWSQCRGVGVGSD